MPIVNARQSLYIQAMHGALVLVVVVAASVLAYADKLDGQTVAVLLGAAITFAGGAAQSLGTLGTAVNGKAVVSNASLADREATIRTALAASAASPAHTIEPEPEPEDEREK